MVNCQFFGIPSVFLNRAAVVDFASTKVISLLAYLAVTQKEWTRSEIEGLLWGESDQKKAQSSLRSALYNINKRLDGPLLAGRKTVGIDSAILGPSQIDVLRFEQMLSGDHPDDWREAIGLYHGPFMDGVFLDDAPEFEHWLLVMRERTRQIYTDGLHRLITYEIKAGENEAAIEYLKRLLEIEPWQEVGHRTLMRLYAREGSYNAALIQYVVCKEILERELGVAPMPETAELDAHIRQLRERPPAERLPHVVSPIIGRDRELTQISNRILDDACRLVSLIGYGGIGKSRLALACGHRLQRQFMDGIIFVPLADIADRDRLILAILDQLDVTIPPNKNAFDFLITHLKGCELLLILDNLEQMIDDAAELISQLLTRLPGLKIIATSRERLMLRDEALFVLEGLSYDSPAEDGLGEAQTLFFERARLIHTDWIIDEPTGVAIDRICQLLEGSPLAIELSASQLHYLSCIEIQARLEAQLTELNSPFRDLPHRQRSIRSVFNTSWQLLDKRQQEILAAMALFRNGFDGPAAEKITGCRPPDLQDLVSKSLIQYYSGRYSLHQLVSQFAVEQLESMGHFDQTAAAHSRYYQQQLGDGTTVELDERTTYFSKLAPDVENIRRAWLFVVVRQDWDRLSETVHPLVFLFESLNRYREARLLFQETVDVLPQKADREDQRLALGKIWNRYATQLVRTGDIRQAQAWLEKSIELLEKLEEESELGFALNLKGASHLLTSQFDEAIEAFERCTAIYQQLALPEIIKPLVNLGSLYLRTGRYEDGINVLEQGLPLARNSGNLRGLAHIYNNISACYIVLERWDEAQTMLKDCISLCNQTGFHTVKVVALQNLADIYVSKVMWADARSVAQESIDLAREIGNEIYELIGYKWLLLGLIDRGHAEESISILRSGMILSTSVNSPATIMEWLAGVARYLDRLNGGADQTNQAQAERLVGDILRLLLSHQATQGPTLNEIQPLLQKHAVEAQPTGQLEDEPKALEEMLDQIGKWIISR